MVDVNLCTTFLTVAAIGLFAGAFAAPAASADTEVPPSYPGECMQVYFFVAEIGPLTVDASDSCWQIILEHRDECDPDTAVDPVSFTDECRQAIQESSRETIRETCEEELSFLSCAIVEDPCTYLANGCHCTCDPIRESLLPT